MMNRIFQIGLIIFFCYLRLFGDDYANDFLELPVSPAVNAKGNSGLCSVSDFYSGYYNPGLINRGGNGVSLSHSEYFGGLLTHDALGAVLKYKEESIGLVIVRVAVENIPDTRDALIDYNNNGILDPDEYLDMDKVSYFSNSDYVGCFSYGKRYKGFDLGVNAKLLYRSLADERGFGMGLDLGAYRHSGLFDYALVLRNITTTAILWSTGKKEYSNPQIECGLKYHIPQYFSLVNADLLFDMIFYTQERGQSVVVGQGFFQGYYTIGLETVVAENFYFRMGLNSSNSGSGLKFTTLIQKAFTTGVGIRWKRFQLDYAFIRNDFLNNTHKLGISYKIFY